jgi:hypothetical protein
MILKSLNQERFMLIKKVFALSFLSLFSLSPRLMAQTSPSTPHKEKIRPCESFVNDKLAAMNAGSFSSPAAHVSVATDKSGGSYFSVGKGQTVIHYQPRKDQGPVIKVMRPNALGYLEGKEYAFNAKCQVERVNFQSTDELDRRREISIAPEDCYIRVGELHLPKPHKPTIHPDGLNGSYQCHENEFIPKFCAVVRSELGQSFKLADNFSSDISLPSSDKKGAIK